MQDKPKRIHLSEKQLEVLLLIDEGLSTKLIADKLGCSVKSIERIRERLHKKFDVHNVTALIKAAREQGFLEKE
jgi:DNA-binding CsgD family transcriptional regulator